MDIGRLYYDKEKLEKGTAVKIGDGTVYVGRTGGKRWNEAVLRHQTEVLDAQDGKVDEREVMAKIYAEGCVLGMEGFTANGAELEYNTENAIALCKTDVGYERVMQAANNIDAFLVEEEHRLGESSKKKSNGK